MSQRKIQNSVTNLIESLKSLDIILNYPKVNNIMIDAAIYRYQVAYRLLWKSLKRILEFEGYSSLDSPREILRLCFSINWIDRENDWLEIISINNQVIQAYTDEQLSIQLFYRIKDVFEKLEGLSIKMKEKYKINLSEHII